MYLSNDLNSAINFQIAHELRNQNTYLQIASYLEDCELKNLASYFKKQADGEYDHAQLFISHLNNRIGGKVTIPYIEKPLVLLDTPEEIGKLYLEVEQKTTESIEDIMDLVMEMKSYIDMPFILKMLDEQVEEEDSAMHLFILLNKVKDLVLFDATFEG